MAMHGLRQPPVYMNFCYLKQKLISLVLNFNFFKVLLHSPSTLKTNWIFIHLNKSLCVNMKTVECTTLSQRSSEATWFHIKFSSDKLKKRHQIFAIKRNREKCDNVRYWKSPVIRHLNRLRLNISTLTLLNSSPHISYGTSWENLIKHQDLLSLLIIPLIFMTWCWLSSDIVKRNYMLISIEVERVHFSDKYPLVVEFFIASTSTYW